MKCNHDFMNKLKKKNAENVSLKTKLKTPEGGGRKRLVLGKRRGMALVITMILVPILMGLGASFVDPIIRSYRTASSYQKDVLAKNIAENMFEIAMEEARDLGVGENAEGVFSGDYNGIHAEAKWWVFGSPELDPEHTFEEAGVNWYTIPAAGSGNAGGDYCSTSDPAVTIGEIDLKLENLGVSTTIPSDTVTFGTPRDPFEWPCHWNKLYEGQTVSIPLYVDELGNIQNPTDLDLNEFELRIRAACDPLLASGNNEIYKDEICDSELNERYELDADGDGSTLENDMIIVLWEIVAEEADSPTDPRNSTGRNFVLSPFKSGIWTNSNLVLDKINLYTTPGNNLNETSETGDNIDYDNCKNHSIIEHLQNGMTACGPRQFINKPILNFTLIHTLQDINGNSVPYLEYQFRTPVQTDKPSIASNEKLVRTEVMLDGGYSETIEKSIDLTKPVTGFVIQQ
jgi:hypothetical protein